MPCTVSDMGPHAEPGALLGRSLTAEPQMTTCPDVTCHYWEAITPSHCHIPSGSHSSDDHPNGLSGVREPPSPRRIHLTQQRPSARPQGRCSHYGRKGAPVYRSRRVPRVRTSLNCSESRRVTRCRRATATPEGLWRSGLQVPPRPSQKDEQSRSRLKIYDVSSNPHSRHRFLDGKTEAQYPPRRALSTVTASHVPGPAPGPSSLTAAPSRQAPRGGCPAVASGGGALLSGDE